MRIYARRELNWNGNKLYYNRKYLGYSLEEHPAYEGMFYINTPTGKTDDFYNRARAKQHAFSIQKLDTLKTGQQTALGASLVSFTPHLGTQVPNS